MPQNQPKESRDTRQRLRSHTGCYKCRKRHKKCDEKRPKCTSCLKWNFVCLWPNTPGSGKVLVIPEIPKINAGMRAMTNTPELPTFRYGPSWSNQERQAFDFFLTQTSKTMSGVFCIDRETNVWSYMLLQGAHQTDSVKHALCAFGALHQHLSNKAEKPDRKPSQTHRFAVEQYNKAMQCTMYSTHRSVGTILIMCLLLTLLERLLGDMQNAMSHLRAGMKLLTNSAIHPTDSQQSTTLSEKDSYIPRARIGFLLRRLERQMFELGQTHQESVPPQSPLFSIDIPTVFLSLEDAVESYEIYFNRASYLMHTCVWKEDEQRQAQKPVEPDSVFLLRRILVKWEAAFMAFLQDIRPGSIPSSTSDELMIHTLHLSRLVLSFSLVHYQTGDEMICDNFTALFSEAVMHGAALIYAQRQTTDSIELQERVEASIPPRLKTNESKPLLSDPPVSAQHPPPGQSRLIKLGNLRKVVMTFSPFTPDFALYTIAWRCRDPTVRRRAAQLLRDIDCCDAFMDSKLFYRFVERIIQIEENGYLAGEAYVGHGRVIGKAEQILPAARCRQVRGQIEKPDIYILDYLSINANEWVPEPEYWNGPDPDSFCMPGRIRERCTVVD